jgi:hypothetical protein
MDVVAPIQGFRKSFTFERQNDLKFYESLTICSPTCFAIVASKLQVG